MQRTRVKICGITSREDANAAVEAGADALGVILAPSPRQVTIDEAEDILSEAPPFVSRVGVFVDADEDYVKAAVERLSLAAVQFHGSESPERCSAACAPVIKVFRVGTGFDSQEMEPFQGAATAVLLDTLDPHAHGGTGKTLPWQRVAEIPGWAPLILAGGLNPVNVGAAIEILRPYAVDVSSGVEERPRLKDVHKMSAFVAAVRAADTKVPR